MRMLHKIIRAIDKAEMALAMIALTGFTTIVFANAAARVFKHPLNWATDIALFLFAWTAFLGGDVAFRHGRLVNVSLLVEFLPLKLQKLAAALVYAVILAFLYCMVRYGVVLCGTTRHRTFNGVPGFSYLWVTIAIPICCSLMGLTAVTRLFALLKSRDRAEVAKM
jgi:TRAP-type C4-dicarboxylate transport system permease small subunit